jgi:transcription elongation factor GreA
MASLWRLFSHRNEDMNEFLNEASISTYLTLKGLQELEAELEYLRTVERPLLAGKLHEVMENLDPSEDSEYLLLKDEQAMLEGRIAKLERILSCARIIQPGNGSEIISIGSSVMIQEDNEPIETYTIVGSAEADSKEGLISNESPLGKALLGHKVGDKVSVSAPDGEIIFKIIRIL